MQQGYSEENPQFSMITQEQNEAPKEQFQQKNFDQEDFFDTLIEARENGSNLSNLSEETQQSFISIYMSDYIAKKENTIKFSSRILDVKQFLSDVYQSNTLEIYSDFSDQSNIRQKNNQKESQKHLNLNQIQKSLQQIQNLYRKWLQKIQSLKQHNNQQSRINSLKQKFIKFQQQQQKMLQDQLIFKWYIEIINQNFVICQEHTKELKELESFFKIDNMSQQSQKLFLGSKIFQNYYCVEQNIGLN